MNVEAVIGANYGDEGKGLFTDYLCANRPFPVVIMTNGGSQRGHTVELEDGTRFVFHHFCSGTFRKAPTYFPKSYLLNPMQFIKEYDELVKLGYAPLSYRHPDCIIQLPGDIALNWYLEKSRGDKKHGSVGCGIWETKYRMYHNDSCTLDKFCAMSYNTQVSYIKSQAVKYRNIRCKEEKFSNYAEIYDLFMSNGFISHFIADCIRMKELCIKIDHLTDICIYPDKATYIFENGQGLKLDQFYGASDEANTTPSFTGSIGIAKILNDENINKIDSINMNYISRTYLTKHGVGKFSEKEHDDNFLKNGNTRHPIGEKIAVEISNINTLSNTDKTNVANEWQDSLRFAKLDYEDLLKRCDKDIIMFNKFLDNVPNVNRKIVMTHVNEIPINEEYLDKIKYISEDHFSKNIKSSDKI